MMSKDQFVRCYFTSRGHGVGFFLGRPEVYGKQDAKILTEIAETFRIEAASMTAFIAIKR